MKIKDYIEINEEITLLALSYLLDKSRTYLLYNKDLDLDEKTSTRLTEIIKKVENNYPLQYAIGKWNFYGLDLICDKRALIPRSETELLVEKILEADIDKEKILDIGTGTGAISLALAKNLPSSKIIGLDISKDAISLANENKENLSIKNVDFKISDIYSNIDDKYNIIVSNPPYIDIKDYNKLDEKLYYEPKNALLGGDDGLYFYRRIIKDAKKYLKNKGFIFLEIGYNQKEEIENLLKSQNFKNIKSYKDYNGFDRIVISNI